MPLETIAQKLNISPGDVLRRYAELKMAREVADMTGFDGMVAAFNVLCLQYQMMGEGFKVIGNFLSNKASPEEVRQALAISPDDSMKNLMSSFVILRPFKAPEVPAPPPTE